MKWEYKTVKLQPNSFLVGENSSFELLEVDKFINQFGQEGWELAATQGINDVYLHLSLATKTTFIVLFFKRPLAE